MTRSALSLRIPRELVSPNKWNGMHWRTKHRLSQAWEADLWALTVNRIAPATTKRRLQVTRETPSSRNFIRDTDNLFGACKPLCDALKRVGLVKDDRSTWLEIVQPAQRVSADGQHWTLIELSEA